MGLLSVRLSGLSGSGMDLGVETVAYIIRPYPLRGKDITYGHRQIFTAKTALQKSDSNLNDGVKYTSGIGKCTSGNAG